MTDRRFPVAGTELTVPWEVAEQAIQKWCQNHPLNWDADDIVQWKEINGGLMPGELDTWYGEHWREVAR